MQKRLREEELRILRDEQGTDDRQDAGPSAGYDRKRNDYSESSRQDKSRNANSRRTADGAVVQGSVDGGVSDEGMCLGDVSLSPSLVINVQSSCNYHQPESESDEMSDDDITHDSDSADSEEVSLASMSGSGSDSIEDDDEVSGSDISNNSEAKQSHAYYLLPINFFIKL